MSHYRDGKGQLPGPCPAGQGVNHRSFARQLLTLALDDSATGEEAIASRRHARKRAGRTSRQLPDRLALGVPAGKVREERTSPVGRSVGRYSCPDVAHVAITAIFARPPSTSITVPWTNVDSSLARYTAAGAMASGVPLSPAGVPRIIGAAGGRQRHRPGG